MVPAFAVVARDKAMIVVRGTRGMADWTININMVPEDVTYYTGKDGAQFRRPGTCRHDEGC